MGELTHLYYKGTRKIVPKNSKRLYKDIKGPGHYLHNKETVEVPNVRKFECNICKKRPPRNGAVLPRWGDSPRCGRCGRRGEGRQTVVSSLRQ